MVSWSPLSTVVWPDLAGYLVFCTRGDDLQVFNPSYHNNQYVTGQILCQASAPVAPAASAPSSAAGITTAIEVGAPSMFQNLDPNYLCSGLLPPTQTSLRLGTLQNGILYTVGVAAVDNSGNASPIPSGFIQTPIATGKAGCSCHFAGVDRGAGPWAAMLALGVASRLRRRGKRPSRSS
jgi:MYXO-CTERM domain-containing protein